MDQSTSLDQQNHSPLYLNQPRGRGHKSVLKPICAAGSGLKTSLGDKAESQIKLKKVDIVVESQDANKIKIPKELLLNILGKDIVMKFVVREIVTSAVTDYVEKENLAVKEKKLKTTQTEDELKQLFSPGSAFSFNAEIELETEENETNTSNS
ncbi:hypothetical protein KSS87_006111 [Heliosperma pusillum]|nr:hypothetical protein KSS87_006111 [Heliosperma pusillum]